MAREYGEGASRNGSRLQNKSRKNFLITTADYVFNWTRKSALRPMTFGLVAMMRDVGLQSC
jgi:NADH:ubiquinone oxidoreductase subunit B-like Fe-S oxidoreductase